MRPSIRKTPNATKKSTAYGEHERLVLNEQNDNKAPVGPPKPRFNLSRNKKADEDKTKNVYEALNAIGKDQPKQVKDVINKHKFKFSSRANIKEGALVQEKKQELVLGQIRKQDSVQKLPQRPIIETQQAQKDNLKPKLSLGRIKKDIKKTQYSLVPPPEENIYTNKSQQFQVSQHEESVPFRKHERSNEIRQADTKPIDIPIAPRIEYKIDIAELQDRQINITEENKPLNFQKQSKQVQRVSKLKNLINLELDMYQPMMNLQSVTEYQLYISKIKSGTVNNSQDQAFDDKMDKGCQHAPNEIFDFANQTPDDKKITYIRGLEPAKNTSLSLYSFISKAVTVIEELLRPPKSFSMPPIYLLSLNPQLVGLFNCPLPISLYKCNDLSLALFGQKLYVARGQITTLLSIGSLLLGGTEEGSILIWSGHKEKSSFYESVKSILGNSDFQLPSCSSDYLERQSYFKGSSQIVSLSEKINNQFYSLEQFGKLITWSIVSKTQQSKIQYSLQPLNYISLSSLYSNTNLLCRFMLKDPSQQVQEDRRQESFKHRYFITCSKGIVKNISESGYPNYFNTFSDVVSMIVTVRGGLIYTICEDRYLRIYSKSLSQPLLQILIPSSYPLESILLPSISLEEGKQLQILAQIYVSNTKGQVFHYHLLENTDEPKEVIRPEMSEDKNLLKSAVSLNLNKIEFMFVTRELRTVYSSQTCNINMAKTPQNFKRIIEQDKRLIEYLNSFI